VAAYLQDGGSPITREFDELNRAAELLPHPTVPRLGLPPIHLDDSFQHARDALFPDDDDLKLDRRLMAERYLAAIPDTDPAHRIRARQAIRDSLADVPELLEWFDNDAPDPPPAPEYHAKPPLGLTPDGELVVDTTRYGVEDVSDAARLACRLLGVDERPVEYAPTEQPNHNASSLTALRRRAGAMLRSAGLRR
jgi:hypothetical protein